MNANEEVTRYFHVKSGPLLEAMYKMRDSNREIKQKWLDWASKFGGAPGCNSTQCLGVTDCTPKGWVKNGSINGWKLIWRPRAADKELYKEWQSLPKMINSGDVLQQHGFTMSLSVVGGGFSFSAGICNFEGAEAFVIAPKDSVKELPEGLFELKKWELEKIVHETRSKANP